MKLIIYYYYLHELCLITVVFYTRDIYVFRNIMEDCAKVCSYIVNYLRVTDYEHDVTNRNEGSKKVSEVARSL